MGLGRRRKSRHGSALLAEGLVRKRRHHYRGGALVESDDSHSCDSECSCEEYSDDETYSEDSDESYNDVKGGRIVSKQFLRKRL